MRYPQIHIKKALLARLKKWNVCLLKLYLRIFGIVIVWNWILSAIMWLNKVKCRTRLSTYHSPTDLFTTFKLQNPPHGVPELHKILRSPDFEALKLWKDRAGVWLLTLVPKMSWKRRRACRLRFITKLSSSLCMCLNQVWCWINLPSDAFCHSKVIFPKDTSSLPIKYIYLT